MRNPRRLPTNVFVPILFVFVLVLGVIPASTVNVGSLQKRFHVAVLEGEGAVNIIQRRTAVTPVVEVRDENGLPVAGVSVTFFIANLDRATFAQRLPEFTAVTDSRGRVIANGFRALSRGEVQIQVRATFQGETALTTINQTNFMTMSDAASAGYTPSETSVGSSSGGSAPGSASGIGSAAGGVSTGMIAVVGAAAAGTIIGVTALQGDGTHTPSTGPATTRGEAARIVTPPQSQSVAFNGSASFTVGVSGTEPISYQWYNNGNALANGSNVSGANTPRLSLVNLQLFNAGSIRVDINNAFGSDSATATLSIADAGARIVSPPQSQTAPFNGSVTFTVIATGAEPLRYQWYNNGQPLANGTNVTGVTTPTVTMSRLQPFNQGTVRVDVSNSFGSDSATVTLVVR